MSTSVPLASSLISELLAPISPYIEVALPRMQIENAGSLLLWAPTRPLSCPALPRICVFNAWEGIVRTLMDRFIWIAVGWIIEFIVVVVVDLVVQREVLEILAATEGTRYYHLHVACTRGLNTKVRRYGAWKTSR
jgi:hypothetical protein